MILRATLYRAFFEHSPRGMALIGPDGTFIDANPAFASLLTYPRDTLRGMPLRRLLDPVDDAAAQQALSDGTQRTITLTCHQQQDETPVVISCSLTTIHDNGRPITLLHIIHDITDDTMLQTADEEKRFIDDMLNHIDNLIFVADRNGKFIYTNETVTKQYGYSRDELLSMHIEDIDINYNPAHRDHMWDLLTKGGIRQIQSIHADKQGGLHPVFIRSQYIEYKGEGYNFGVIEDQSRLQDLFDLQEGFVILTDGRELQMTNRHLLEFFNYPSFEEFRYDHRCICDFFIDEGDYIRNTPHWVEDVQRAVHRDAKVKIRQPHTKKYHIFLVRAAVYDDTRFVVTFIDITHLEDYKEQLHLLATTDDMTGLYNRRFFNHTFPSEINRARRDGRQLALLIADVDFFKQYNDTYGHLKGDEVLAAIGAVFRRRLNRAGDFGFRLGGEEFGILCTVESSEEALRIADWLCGDIRALAIPHEKNPPHAVVTISIGIVLTDGSATPEELYAAADAQLYRAKAMGRNRICLD